MMPPSPSPSLKFRTAGFPRYGFKASLSGRAFPNASAVKPAPGIPVCAPGLHRPFARFHDGRADPALCPDPAVLPRAAVRAALVPLYPRGPWLRSEFCCLGPSSLTPTPSAGLAGTRRFHGPATYTCGECPQLVKLRASERGHRDCRERWTAHVSGRQWHCAPPRRAPTSRSNLDRRLPGQQHRESGLGRASLRRAGW